MTSNLLTTISQTSKLALGLAGCAAAVAIAFATVTIDEEGFGFVGKGDVKNAFGWTNEQLDANAAGVSFSFESLSRYDAICEWTTGEGTRGEKTHRLVRKVKAGVDTTVLHAIRKNNQGVINGFTLAGFANPLVEGDEIPTVGDPCIGQGTGAVYVSVTPVEESTPGGLYIQFGDEKVLLEVSLD